MNSWRSKLLCLFLALMAVSAVAGTASAETAHRHRHHRHHHRALVVVRWKLRITKAAVAENSKEAKSTAPELGSRLRTANQRFFALSVAAVFDVSKFSRVLRALAHLDRGRFDDPQRGLRGEHAVHAEAGAGE